MIRNVRLGFAANSSSTHSIVLLSEKRAVGDDLAEDGGFGWEHFTCASKEAKKRYADVVLRQAIWSCVPASLRVDVARALDVDLGHDPHDYSAPQGDYIDHQSVPVIPRDLNGQPNFDFLRDLRAYLVETKGLVILGGNDNTEDDHPLESQGKRVLDNYPREYGGVVVRREGLNTRAWTLFNPGNGTRISLDFTLRNPESGTGKLRSPLLVDLKITDLCHMKCPYCYQGSTKDGKVGDDVHQWIGILKDMEVFEVALGGGEPTTHEDFLSILKGFRGSGIVPNFTTRNLAWLRDPINARVVADTCGTFALSVDSKEPVEELKRILICHEEAEIHMPSPQIQVVMGAITDFTLEGIFAAAREARFSVTLLGFKNVGRGEKWSKPSTAESLVKLLTKCKKEEKLPYRVGIDTALARELEPFLKDSDVPKFCYFTKEGESSMYIDAVTNSIGPSSYNPEAMVKLGKYPKASDVLSHFSKW